MLKKLIGLTFAFFMMVSTASAQTSFPVPQIDPVKRAEAKEFAINLFSSKIPGADRAALSNGLFRQFMNAYFYSVSLYINGRFCQYGVKMTLDKPFETVYFYVDFGLDYFAGRDGGIDSDNVAWFCQDN